MSPDSKPGPHADPLRIALLYAAVGAAWIYGSDAILASLMQVAQGSRFMQTAKGILFVAVTALFLWALLARWVKKIQTSEAALRLTQFSVDHAPDSVYWIDESGRLVYVNESACTELGYSRDEILNMSIWEIDLYFTPARWQHHWREVQEKGCLVKESEQRLKNGNLIPVEMSVSAVSSEARRLICAFVRNIRERRRAETQGREHSRRLSLLLDSMPGYAFIKDTAFAYVIANRRMCDDLRVPPSEIPGKTDFDILLKGTAERIRADDIRVLESGELDIEEECVEVGGTERWFTTRKIPLVKEDGQTEGLIGVSVDITQRKQMQLALRETEERFEAALVGAPIPVMMHAEDGAILLLSRSWTKLSGYSASDIPSLADWQRKALPDRVDDPESRAGTVEKRIDEGLLTIRTKSGTERTWNVFSAPLGRFSDGRRVMVTMAVDLTDRLRLEQQFLEAQKMEAVGRLAGGVAHDFNNLLTVILGYCQLLSASADDQDRVLIDEVIGAAERAAALTKQLLAFSRRQVVQPVLLDVNSGIRSLERMLRRIIGEDVALIVNLPAESYTVRMDATQFDQVLLNLAVNARDAMPEGGTLVIATSRVSPGPGQSEPETQPANWVSIQVSDSGHGMPAAVRERVFEPFFTTKERGKGTGLGLSTVHGIIQQAGGSITVASEPGEGATFSILLPAATGDRTTPEAKPVPTALTHSTAKVMVVEDDASIRTLIVKILTEAQFEVTTAQDASDALTVLGSEKVDVVLSDVVLPGMSGVELARRIGGKQPQIPVVFMSGYADVESTQNIVLPQGAILIPKPFKPDVLVGQLRAVLRPA